MRLIKEKRIISLVTVLFLGMLFLRSGSVWADEKDEMIQKLMKRVDQLENKVDTLNNKLQAYEQKPVATVSDELVRKKVDEMLSQREAKAPTIIGMPKITGFVDTTYNYSFNKPASQTTLIGTPGTTVAGTESNLASYTTKANSFLLNTAHINFDGSLKDVIGYHVEFDAGSDAKVNTPGTSAGAPDDFDLQEAYFTSPIFNTGVNLKVGKFVTLEGIEVIESPLDPTISRGYLFGLAEPFTHVGFLLSRALPIKGLEARAGLVNGWDLLADNNTGKTVLGGLGINYGDLATGALSVYHGPEQASNDKNNRTSIDLTIATKPMSKLTLNLQGNWGKEDGISGATDRWHGVGIQPVYQFTDKLSLAGRVEYMRNKRGSRFGNSGGEMTNFTVTPGYKLNDSATVRVEYRHDIANKDFFEGHSGKFGKDSVNQILTEFFYTF